MTFCQVFIAVKKISERKKAQNIFMAKCAGAEIGDPEMDEFEKRNELSDEDFERIGRMAAEKLETRGLKKRE